MPVELMLKCMSSAEITEWMAYIRVKHEEEEAEKLRGKNVWRPPDD